MTFNDIFFFLAFFDHIHLLTFFFFPNFVSPPKMRDAGLWNFLKGHLKDKLMTSWVAQVPMVHKHPNLLIMLKYKGIKCINTTIIFKIIIKIIITLQIIIKI